MALYLVKHKDIFNFDVPRDVVVYILTHLHIAEPSEKHRFQRITIHSWTGFYCCTILYTLIGNFGDMLRFI
jgi:hypothetical protein